MEKNKYTFYSRKETASIQNAAAAAVAVAGYGTMQVAIKYRSSKMLVELENEKQRTKHFRTQNRTGFTFSSCNVK